MQQIITEFFEKSLRIILESRALNVSSRKGGDKSDSSLYSSSSPSATLRDKWFNLSLRDCSAAFGDINHLESHSLVVDVILVHRSLDRDPMVPRRVLPKSCLMKERYPLCYHGEELGVEAKSGKIVERWVVQYENRKVKDSTCRTKKSSQNLYKKLAEFLSFLYAKVRHLPAYQIFNDLSSSASAPIRPFTLAHRVASFVEPFTLKEESEMMEYRFIPVDTSSGRLCLKVMYCPSASKLIGNLFPRVIPDYVGSLSADPSRKLPSFPLAGVPSALPKRSSSNFEAVNSSRYTDMQSEATAEKVFSLGKDEPQKFYGDRISANSLRISSTHPSFDGTEYNCPFAYAYDDMKGPADGKSNDAAVGELIEMLNNAQPLHQDFYSSEQSSGLCRGQRRPAETCIQEASIARRKTTRDALKEFDDYMEMKNWLISKSHI